FRASDGPQFVIARAISRGAEAPCTGSKSNPSRKMNAGTRHCVFCLHVRHEDGSPSFSAVQLGDTTGLRKTLAQIDVFGSQTSQQPKQSQPGLVKATALLMQLSVTPQAPAS